MFFYGTANQVIESWAHRRRSRMYADVGLVISSIVGIAMGAIVTGEFPIWTPCVAGLVSIFAVMHAIHELKVHDEMIAAWMQCRAKEGSVREAGMFSGSGRQHETTEVSD